MTPAEAILAWRQSGQPLPDDTVHRSLAECDTWCPPLRENFSGDSFGPFSEGMLPLIEHEGRPVFPLCSNYDAIEAHRQKHGPSAFGDRRGEEIFTLGWEGAQGVLIDAGTPHELLIERADFPRLQAMTRAVAVERAWQRLHRGDEQPGDLALVAGHGGYHLAAVQKPGGMVMIHVPHDDGGMFVPLFTHADALALAMDEFREGFGDAVRTIEAAGAKVFPAIANETAQGIVMNYRGPTVPLAFSLGITELLLEEIARLTAQESPGG